MKKVVKKVVKKAAKKSLSKRPAKAPKEDPLEKLLKLTKLMKMENVRVAPKGPVRPINKWRSQAPKFIDKPKNTEGLVEAGGMQVDPSLKDEYEKWRQDKIREQDERREMNIRRAEAKRKAWKAQQDLMNRPSSES